MFPETWQIHLAPWVNDAINWLTTNWGPGFDLVSGWVLGMMLTIQGGLLAIPWWLYLVVVAALSFWQTRRPWLPLTLVALFLSAGLFGYWEEAMETLAIMITAVVLALVLGIPLGILMAESNRANDVLAPLLDAMQTMPSFVYLIPAMMLFGLGKVPAVFAVLVYALPPVMRLTNLGIRQVSTEVQEAARAFGATRLQMLTEVRLPLAMPSIMAGVNQTTMMALAMVVIASMVGAGGLGEKVLIAVNRIDAGTGFEAGFVVVALAIVIDRLTQGVGRRWEHSGR